MPTRITLSNERIAIGVASTAVVSAPLWSITSYAIVFLAGLLIAAACALQMAQNKGVLQRRLTLAGYPLLLAWAVVSSTWAIDAKQSLTASAALFGFMMIGYAFATANRQGNLPEKIQFTSRGLAIFGLLVAVACIAVFGTLRPEAKREHFLGSFDTRLASYMAAAVPLATYGLVYNHRRLLSGLAIACAILAGLLTQTRSGTALPVFSILLSLGVFALWDFRRVPKSIWSTSILILAMGLASGVFLWESGLAKPVTDRIIHINPAELFQFGAPELGDNDEDFGRKAMYATGWDVVREFSFTGIGYNSLGYLVEDRYGRYVMSHNIFITVFGELGLIGGALFCLCISAFICDTLRAYRSQRTTGDPALIVSLAITVFVVLLIAQIRPQQDNPMLFASVGAIHALAHNRQWVKK